MLQNPSDLLSSIHRLRLTKEALTQVLESVDFEIRSKQAQYNQNFNERCHVYKLPNELLASIFMMCCDISKLIGKRKHRPTFRPFPVVASHVSHRWRDVALGTPLLWNTFTFEAQHRHSNEGLVEQLEAYLERSGTCFLDIVATFPLNLDLSIYCDLLGKHSRRWRRLWIQTSTGVLPMRTMLLNATVPVLEHLSLEFGISEPATSQKFPEVVPSVLLSGCPRLSFLRLGGQALGQAHPPTCSVTTLHLDGWSRHYMTHDQFKFVMDGTPLLINLSIDQLCVHLPRDPLTILEPATLIALRSLRIRGPCSPSRLMSLLDLPQVESITLEGLEEFDSHVLPTVRSLFLIDCGFSEQDASNLTQSLPCLSDLSIDDSESFDIFFRLHRLVWWPQLQTITLRRLHPGDVAPFCTTVHNRQSSVGPNGSSPLRKIILDRRSRTVLEAKERLDWLQDIVPVEYDDSPRIGWPIDLGYKDPHD